MRVWGFAWCGVVLLAGCGPRLCPGDCGTCTAVCGDFVCDPGDC